MSDISVEQVASYIVKHDECNFGNSFDGNMKLQKLLVFANLINFINHNEPLFNEEMHAFKNGIVVEDVRKPFSNNYFSYMEQLNNISDLEFNESQSESIDMSIALFNNLSAKELSDLHHELETWKYKFNKSKVGNSYDKHISKINLDDFFDSDLERIKKVIKSYNGSKEENFPSEIVGGITFFYDPKKMDFSSDDEELINVLQDIANTIPPGEDDTYFVDYDEEQGIYYY